MKDFAWQSYSQGVWVTMKSAHLTRNILDVTIPGCGIET